MTHLNESIAFDVPNTTADGYGGSTTGWTESFTTRGDFIYQRGDEAEQGGKATGAAVFKVKLRSFSNSRGLTTDDRMRDVRRSVSYNIREIDAISDRHWVWIVVENGVAV